MGRDNMPGFFDENYEEDRTTHRLANPDNGPMSKDSFTSAVNGIDRAMSKPTAVSAPVPDPFGPEEVGGLQAIVQMRIYDILFALLDEKNSEKAEYIADLHREGKLFMSSPRFTGEFVDDTLQDGEEAA